MPNEGSTADITAVVDGTSLKNNNVDVQSTINTAISNGISQTKDNVAVQTTDPAVYDEYKTKFAELPAGGSAWVARAAEVSAILSEDAAQRDRENKSPRAEIALLKHAGLLKVLGPRQYGGGGQGWDIGYKTIREVAKGDG
jgi:hypothetical protein